MLTKFDRSGAEKLKRTEIWQYLWYYVVRWVDWAIVTINWFIWVFDAKQKSSEWFQNMSVSRVASKVNLCKWAGRGGDLFGSECQAKQLYTSFLFTGREASHLIMHSSFWCFDEVLKFGQKGHVQFITPNCSGCVLVSAICQMYEGLNLKKTKKPTRANDANSKLFIYLQQREGGGGGEYQNLLHRVRQKEVTAQEWWRGCRREPGGGGKSP